MSRPPAGPAARNVHRSLNPCASGHTSRSRGLHPGNPKNLRLRHPTETQEKPKETQEKPKKTQEKPTETRRQPTGARLRSGTEACNRQPEGGLQPGGALWARLQPRPPMEPGL